MNYDKTEFIEKLFKWTSNVLIWTTGYEVMSVVQTKHDFSWFSEDFYGGLSYLYVLIFPEDNFFI